METNSFRAAPVRFALTILIGGLAAATAFAQAAPELPQPSPLARTEQRVGVTDFAIEYSSPGVKDRKIWGELVPYDELWRTGANAATKLEASRDFRFGGVDVPAGTYALYTIPGKKTWTVLLNKNADASGTRGYDKSLDVARVEVEPQSADNRERMTFLFADTTDDSTRLDLEWAGKRISVPIEVDTAAHANANIDAALADAWRPHFAAARYLLQNDGDLETALGYANTSVAVQPTWWNTWVKAQILGKLDRKQDAIAAAQQARALGKGDAVFEGFFASSVGKAIEDWQ